MGLRNVLVPVVVGALVLAAVGGCSSSAESSSSTSSLTSLVPGTVTSGSVSRPAFRVDPASTLDDEPVDIGLTGLPAGSQVAVTAKASDADGTVWQSAARFTATPAGTVSLAQPSTGGSYQGSNPMGLFEFMLPASSSKAQIYHAPDARSFPVALQATVNGAVVAQVMVDRETYLSKNVESTNYLPASSGIYGTYFPAPPSTGRRPAVLVFGGSEGGNFALNEGKILAGRGIPTLTLAYFREPGLPSTLTKIPLEYFQKALQVLAGEPGVDPSKIFVWGISRGSEAALL